MFAISAVLSVFMLGLAAGGFLAGRLLQRTRDVTKLFGQVHIALCLATAATLPLLPAARALYIGGSYLPGWALQPAVLLLSGLVLLAPTSLMGATLPVASEAFANHREALGRDIGRLYAAGTVGSMGGAVAAAFVLLPGVGTSGTIGVAALVDALIALVAILATSRSASDDAALERS
jgi:spermidine synthase